MLRWSSHSSTLPREVHRYAIEANRGRNGLDYGTAEPGRHFVVWPTAAVELDPPLLRLDRSTQPRVFATAHIVSALEFSMEHLFGCGLSFYAGSGRYGRFGVLRSDIRRVIGVTQRVNTR